MSKSLPEFIDPTLLAKHGSSINGSYQINIFNRLLPLLHHAEGTVNFNWHFTKDLDKRRIVIGKITTYLNLICQRCLSPMELKVERESLLGIVEDLIAADQLPDKMEPLLVEKGVISLSQMVENELILALPVVATHEIGQCPTQKILERYTTNTIATEIHNQNPFAVLKSINVKK